MRFEDVSCRRRQLWRFYLLSYIGARDPSTAQARGNNLNKKTGEKNDVLETAIARLVECMFVLCHVIAYDEKSAIFRLLAASSSSKLLKLGSRLHFPASTRTDSRHHKQRMKAVSGVQNNTMQHNPGHTFMHSRRRSKFASRTYGAMVYDIHPVTWAIGVSRQGFGKVLLRGTMVNMTYGILKNLYI